MLSYISSWATTLSLVFGGCCANALTLEQLTLIYPNFGSLITFLQFVLIALHGLPSHVTWTVLGPRLRPRKIPILPYFGQVVLFFLVSSLNNEAFAYRIPMSVHIIFRSGGLVVSMVFGWFILKKQYNMIQILSVMLVTLGVAFTTLSASQPSNSLESALTDLVTYVKGIAILSAALIFSGFLGLLQEWTNETYGKRLTPSPAGNQPTYRESMFYLHFLGLPLFLPQLPKIKSQLEVINSGAARAETTFPLPGSPDLLTSFFPSLRGRALPIPPPFSLPSLDFLIPPVFRNNTLAYFSLKSPQPLAKTAKASLQVLPKESVWFTASLPKPYLPLFLNTVTQLLCVAGVHRLTTRVSNLTVTLILVVRKAVSLVISLKGRVLAERASQYFGVQDFLKQSPLGAWVWGRTGEMVKTALGVDEVVTGKRVVPVVDERMMWTGAGLVLLGTVGYTVGTSFRSTKTKAKRE